LAAIALNEMRMSSSSSSGGGSSSSSSNFTPNTIIQFKPAATAGEQSHLTTPEGERLRGNVNIARFLARANDALAKSLRYDPVDSFGTSKIDEIVSVASSIDRSNLMDVLKRLNAEFRYESTNNKFLTGQQLTFADLILWERLRCVFSPSKAPMVAAWQIFLHHVEQHPSCKHAITTAQALLEGITVDIDKQEPPARNGVVDSIPKGNHQPSSSSSPSSTTSTKEDSKQSNGNHHQQQQQDSAATLQARLTSILDKLDALSKRMANIST